MAADPNKTAPTDGDVEAFLDAVPDVRRREDARTVCRLMAEVTGATPTMWGDAMIGFGRYHYRYASGRQGEWFRVGVAPRKASLTIYLMDGYEDRAGQLQRLGPHKLGRSCLHLTRLEGVDTDVLCELVADSYATRHPAEI